MKNERAILSEAMTTATFATPRITGALVKASHLSKPFKERSDNLDLAIALTADILNKLTLTRTRLGWNHREDVS